MKVFVMNRCTRSIKRIEKSELDSWLNMMQEKDMLGQDIYVVFQQWPTEQEYFDIGGEW